MARDIKRELRELECTGDMAEKKIRKVTFNKFLDSPLGYTRCDLVLFSIPTERIEITEHQSSLSLANGRTHPDVDSTTKP